MKSSIANRIALLFTASIIFLSSCVSTTLLQTTPSGANVYVKGQNMGTTPYSYSDTKIVGSTTPISFKKDGYQDLNITLHRTEQIDIAPAVVGFFVLWPLWLWIMKYDDTHSYQLQATEPVNSLPNNSSTNNSTNNNSNSTNELIKLKNLLDQGTITSDDFTSLKVKILNDNYDYSNSIADQIIKLKSLLDSNLLTKEEFESQKIKLIK
ncbi:MAG: SHOCT domain-containing protein [Bacteroidota bacterium]